MSDLVLTPEEQIRNSLSQRLRTDSEATMPWTEIRVQYLLNRKKSSGAGE